MKHLTDVEIFEFVERLSSEKERENIAAHIASCAQCREKVEFEQTLSAALMAQNISLPQKNFSSRVMAKIAFVQSTLQHQKTKRREKISLIGWGMCFVAVIATVVFLAQSPELSSAGSAISGTSTSVNPAMKHVGNFISQTNSVIIDYGSKFGLMPLVLTLVFAVLYGLDKLFSKKFLVK